MPGESSVVVKFLGDTSDLADKTDGIGRKIKGAAIGIGAAFAGAFAIDKVTDFVGAAEEAEVASKRLAKTLENAGDSTGAWSKHAEDLAKSLMNQTGIDDEVIKGGQAILATFHAVSGQAGQTSGAFDRATKAAVDLSKTGFGDVNSASKQLGKALEDPVKGMGGLARAGVQFTEAQKDMVKAMVANGDQAGAMNLILGEVESQVGGVAEATATSSDKMAVAWGEAEEALGGLITPLLEKLTPAIQAASGWIQDSLVPALKNLSDWLGGILGPAFAAAWDWIQNKLLPALGNLAGAVGDVLGAGIATAVSWIREKLIPALGDLVKWVEDNREKIGSYFTPYLDAAKAVLPVLGKIAVGFALFGILVAQFVWPAMKKLGEIIDHRREVIPIVAALIMVPLVPALYAWAAAATAAAVAQAAALLPLAGLVAVIALIATAIVLVGQLLGGWGDSWEEAKRLFDVTWWDLQAAYNWITEHWPLLGGILFGPFGWAAGQILDKWDTIWGWFQNLWHWFQDNWPQLGNILMAPYAWPPQVIEYLWGNVLTFFGNLPGWLANALSTVGDILAAPFRWAWQEISGIIDGIKTGFGGAINWVRSIWNGFRDAWNSIEITLPSVSIPFGPTIGGQTIGLPDLPKLARGGIVTGPTLAMIGKRGPEAVIPLSQFGAGNVTINVNVTGLGADAPHIQSAVVAALRGYVGRNGPIAGIAG